MDEEEKARRVQELYREALDLAEQAVLADRQKQYDVAICLYNEAAKVFNQIIDEDLETTDKIIQIQQKANEYVTRASFLTSKNMNYNHNSYINPDSITELPSLYHIVGSFVENNRNNSNTSLEAGTSRPNNSNNSNNYNYSNYNIYNIDNNNYSSNAYDSSSNYNYNQSSPLTNINTVLAGNTSSNINNLSPIASTPTSISTVNSNTLNTNLNVNTTTNTTNTSNTNAPSVKATTPTSITSAAQSTTTTTTNNNNNNQSLSASEEFSDMKYVMEEMGTWNSENAGGSISNYTFYKNPQYKLNIYPTLGENGFLKAIAKTKNNLPVNIRLVGGGERVSTVSKSDITSAGGK